MSYYYRRARHERLVATVFLILALATTTAALYGWLDQSPPILVVGSIVTLVNLYAAWSRSASAAYYQARHESEAEIQSLCRERRTLEKIIID